MHAIARHTSTQNLASEVGLRGPGDVPRSKPLKGCTNIHMPRRAMEYRLASEAINWHMASGQRKVSPVTGRVGTKKKTQPEKFTAPSIRRSNNFQGEVDPPS